jgi:hypothetical protein
MNCKMVLFTIVCAGVLAGHGPQAATSVSSYGSNPYLSYSLFPQDVRSLRSNCISYFPAYEQQPYWGNIDNPANKPNGTYTSTGINVIENNANFYHSAQIYSVANSIGYIQRFLSGLTGTLNLDYNVDSRSNQAKGILTDANSGAHVPFNYSLSHMVNTMRLQGMAGFELLGVPAGIRLDAGFNNTLYLDHSFTFEKGGVSYSTDRATWGWTTSPCAHIFGVSGPHGDAWLQDGYAKGPLYNIDLQAGATLPIAKVGGRFTYLTGHQDYYSWQRDSTTSTGDAVLDKNFLGSYQKGEWSRTTRDGAVQLYGNVPWIKSQRYSLNMFALLGYEGVTQGQALSSNLDIAGSAKDKSHNVNIEIAPNISIPFGSDFSYIDAAAHVEYSYGRFNNTYLRWVGGGQIETYLDTRTSPTDEYSWEGYSYANRNSYDAGIDLSTMFPLYTTGTDHIGLGLLLLIDSRFAFMTKYYGQNIDGVSDVNFQVDNLREDYEREIRFVTGIKVQYLRQPFFGWLECTEPPLRSFMPRTRVTDASGKSILYEHVKEPLWMSLEGIRVGLFLSYEYTLPFLNSL